MSIRQNQIKAGAMLNYIQLIFGVLINILITPILLRKLGQSEYGIINLSTSTVANLQLITLGIGGAYIRFNMRYRTNNDIDGEKKLNATFLVIYLIMALIMAIAGAILVYYSNIIFAEKLSEYELQKIKFTLAISVANIAIALPFSVFSLNINAYEKFIFSNSINIINTIIKPLIWLPILFYGGLSISLTIATTVLHLFTCIAQMIYALKKTKIKFKFGRLDGQLVKQLFIFSSFIVFNQIIDMINWNVDKLILGVVGGTTAVAIYSLGATFNTYTLSFSTAISGVLVPKVHKLISTNADKEQLQDLFNKTGRIQFILVAFIMMAFGFFGKSFIINFYASEEYLDAYYIAILLIVPLVIPLIQNIGIEIQRAYNKHKFRSVLYFIIAIVNIAISIPLAKKYGGIGCAFGTCISLLIGNGLVMNIYYHKGIGLNMWSFWKEIVKFLPSLILPTIVGGLILRYVNTYKLWVFGLCAIGFATIYALSIYFLGMNKYEKQLIKNGLNLIKKRK